MVVCDHCRTDSLDARTMSAYDRLIAAMEAGEPPVIVEALKDRCVRAENAAIRYWDALVRLEAGMPEGRLGVPWIL